MPAISWQTYILLIRHCFRPRVWLEGFLLFPLDLVHVQRQACPVVQARCSSEIWSSTVETSTFPVPAPQTVLTIEEVRVQTSFCYVQVHTRPLQARRYKHGDLHQAQRPPIPRSSGCHSSQAEVCSTPVEHHLSLRQQAFLYAQAKLLQECRLRWHVYCEDTGTNIQRLFPYFSLHFSLFPPYLSLSPPLSLSLSLSSLSLSLSLFSLSLFLLLSLSLSV